MLSLRLLPPPGETQEVKWHRILTVRLFAFADRFELSVEPQNIVPGEDLQPQLILRAKKWHCGEHFTTVQYIK